jgi:uroporphyrinogen decarboxylase
MELDNQFMSALKNQRLIKALQRQPVDKTPVWIMRQAGRYLPEYRKIRQQAGSFMNLCRNPELACEVTLQPLRRFDLDAAIIFCDILVVAEAMGLDLEFVAGEGPKFNNPIQSEKDIAALKQPEPRQDLNYVAEAIQLTQQELQGNVPLIGFCGSPWTLACYMIEGGGSKTFSKIKGLMYRNPKALHNLLEKITQATLAYLTMQIEAGVNAVMIFDTWGGVLSPTTYEAFSLDYMNKIVNQLPLQQANGSVPTTLFTKNGGLWLDKLATANCQGIGLDWTINLTSAKKQLGNQFALQGNLDPCVLYADEAVIRSEVKRVLNEFGTGPGHVFNLGHGIYPDVDPDKVAILVDAVHEYSAR